LPHDRIGAPHPVPKQTTISRYHWVSFPPGEGRVGAGDEDVATQYGVSGRHYSVPCSSVRELLEVGRTLCTKKDSSGTKAT
jgi:hypothetical protein